MNSDNKMKMSRLLTEFQIETNILDGLNKIPGCFAFKVETNGYFDQNKGIYRKRKSKYAIRGTSDIIGVYFGKFFAFEVKSMKGKPTPDQLVFIETVKSKGGIAGIVRSIEDALNLFQKDRT